MLEFERVENAWPTLIEATRGSSLFASPSGNGVDILHFCGFKDVANLLLVHEKSHAQHFWTSVSSNLPSTPYETPSISLSRVILVEMRNVEERLILEMNKVTSK